MPPKRRIRRIGTSVIARFKHRPIEFDDLYHYLLTASWPVLLAFIAFLFVAANLLFALAYYLDRGLKGATNGSFADAFFFSVQTMATIGYGHISPASRFANVMVACEALTGLVGLAVVTGLVFAKFSRATARVRFSKYAVVQPRNGVPCLMFRMANLRANRIVEASIHLAMLCDETTAEGEWMRRYYDLKLERQQTPAFSLSWTVIHPIVEGSPLFGHTHEQLAEIETEIIASLTGLDESFGQTVHARHLYVLDDIVWDARLADILIVTPEGASLDYARFDEVVPLAALADSGKPRLLDNRT
jgi:inward rectifier potassium channel